MQIFLRWLLLWYSRMRCDVMDLWDLVMPVCVMLSRRHHPLIHSIYIMWLRSECIIRSSHRFSKLCIFQFYSVFFCDSLGLTDMNEINEWMRKTFWSSLLMNQIYLTFIWIFFLGILHPLALNANIPIQFDFNLQENRWFSGLNPNIRCHGVRCPSYDEITGSSLNAGSFDLS